MAPKIKEEFLSNPYSFYKKMRLAQEPLYVPHDRLDNSSGGVYLFFCYHEAIELLKKNKNVSKNISKVRPEELRSPYDEQLLLSDDDKHLRLRKILADFFSIQDVSKFIELIEFQSNNCFSQIKHESKIDLINDFVEIYSLNVIVDILGICNFDHQSIRLWSESLLNGIDSILLVNDKKIAQEYQSAKSNMINYIEEIINERNYNEYGLISYLSNQYLEKRINRSELIGLIIEILFNGHFTVSALIGNGLNLLLNHKEQINHLKNNDNALKNMIEEVLRIETPLQRTTYRVTTEPIMINDFLLEKNKQFAVVIGSANRDEKKFINPEKFDIARSSNLHLSFGSGTHNCIGKHLARAEAFSAFKKLIHLIPAWEITQDIVWKKNTIVRGLDSLHVRRK